MAELVARTKGAGLRAAARRRRYVKLADLAGKPVVLYFYPQDDTETCTAEAIDFSAH